MLIFSNNMNYDDNSHLPLQGAFYSSTSTNKLRLNYFRESEKDNNEFIKLLNNVDEKEEDFILNDNNLLSIKSSSEFISNNKPDTPTNKICTSLFFKERFFFFLYYGIAYVNEKDGIEKHILRYPQYFALKKIEKSIDEK